MIVQSTVLPASDWAAGPNAVFAATTASGIKAWNGTAWSELGMLNRGFVDGADSMQCP